MHHQAIQEYTFLKYHYFLQYMDQYLPRLTKAYICINVIKYITLKFSSTMKSYPNNSKQYFLFFLFILFLTERSDNFTMSFILGNILNLKFTKMFYLLLIIINKKNFFTPNNFESLNKIIDFHLQIYYNSWNIFKLHYLSNE